MRTTTTILILSLSAFNVGCGSSAASLAVRGSKAGTHLHCLHGYRCKSIRQDICMRKGEHPPILRQVDARRCTAFLERVSFVAAYNGSRVEVVPGTRSCRLERAAVSVHVTCHTDNNSGEPGPGVSHYLAFTAHVEATRPSSGNNATYGFDVSMYVTARGAVSVWSDYLPA